MRKVWPMAIKFPLFKTRTPDEWEANLRIDRQFLWTILFSVSDAFVIQLVDNCREQRLARIQAKKVPPNFMGINPEMAHRLLAHPFEGAGKYTPLSFTTPFPLIDKKKKGPSLLIARSIKI